MIWHTAVLCTASSRTSFLNRVSVMLILKQSVCTLCVLYKTYIQAVFFTCAEPVCAVGQGVSALCCATEGQIWIFSGFSLTGVSLSLVNIKAIYNQTYWFSMY